MENTCYPFSEAATVFLCAVHFSVLSWFSFKCPQLWRIQQFLLGAWAVPLLILLLGYDFSSLHFYFLNFRPQLIIAYRVQIEKGMGKKETPPSRGEDGRQCFEMHPQSSRESQQAAEKWRNRKWGSSHEESTQGSSYPERKEKAGQLSRAEINVIWGRLQWQDLGKKREESNTSKKKNGQWM